MNNPFTPNPILLVAALLLSASTFAQTPTPKSDPCKDPSHLTQAQMNNCAAKDLRRSELHLEKLMKNLGIAKDSPEQKAWESYRDAQLAALYPGQDISTIGSVYPLCLAILKKKLTDGRIRDLKALTTVEGVTPATVTTRQAPQAAKLERQRSPLSYSVILV